MADIPAEMPAPPPGRLLRVSALVLAMGVEWAATKAAFIIHQPSDGQAAFAYFVPCGCSLFGLVPLVFEVIGGGSRRSDRILPYLSWGWAALCLIAGGFVLLRGP